MTPDNRGSTVLNTPDSNFEFNTPQYSRHDKSLLALKGLI